MGFGGEEKSHLFRENNRWPSCANVSPFTSPLPAPQSNILALSPYLYVLHSDFLNIHFFNYGLFLFIYLFILFLAELGLRCWLLSFSRFAKRGLLSGYGAWASRCGGLSCCGAQALGRLGFSSCGTWAYLQHVGSSWTRYQTRVPCTGRQILNHCTPREAPSFLLIWPTAPFSLLVAWPVLQGSQSTTSPSITSVDGASRTTAIAGEEKESKSSSSQFLPLPFWPDQALFIEFRGLLTIIFSTG